MDQSDDLSLKERLKECGYKFTGQRNDVLDVLVKYSGRHLSTEDIYNIIKSKHPKIGIATIYRTLMVLYRLGLVNKLDLDDGLSRYELVKPNEDHQHHHLICSNCGNIAEVEGDLLESLEKQIFLKNKFLVKDHHLKFYGLCEKCRQISEDK
jgi:Fur family transcriptional regulator, ferric uptake regulator